MSKTIYQYDLPVAQAEPPKPERLPPVAYHARAAALIGLFVFTAVIITGLVFGLDLRLTFKAAALLGIFSAGSFGIYWTAMGTTHDLRMDKAERLRRWEAEDYARYNATAAEVVEDFSVSDNERLELVCWRILRLHYHQGKEATRPECERAGITQTDWNNANKLMQLIGLKGERGWQVVDSREAFDRFEQLARFDKDSIWHRPTPASTSWVRFLPQTD